jgi:hypothetical protein
LSLAHVGPPQEIAAITGRLRDASAALEASEAARAKAVEDLAAATAAASAASTAHASGDKVRNACVDVSRNPVFLFLIHRFHSISFTRAQGILKYKIGF